MSDQPDAPALELAYRELEQVTYAAKAWRNQAHAQAEHNATLAAELEEARNQTGRWRAHAETADDERRGLLLENDAIRADHKRIDSHCAHLREQLAAARARITALTAEGVLAA